VTDEPVLLAVLGLRSAYDGGRVRRVQGVWPVAIHEAGHAIAYLAGGGVNFGRVHVVLGQRQRGKAQGWLSTSGITLASPVRVPPRGVRLALSLAGPAAEDLIFGYVTHGVRSDLATAFALADVAEPTMATADHAGVRELRATVESVRGLLVSHRPALVRLARVLLRTGSLTAPECARVVRDAGSDVNARPRFDPVYPPDERHRVARALAALEEPEARP
jgi:hypothetical protein